MSSGRAGEVRLPRRVGEGMGRVSDPPMGCPLCPLCALCPLHSTPLHSTPLHSTLHSSCPRPCRPTSTLLACLACSLICLPPLCPLDSCRQRQPFQRGGQHSAQRRRVFHSAGQQPLEAAYSRHASQRGNSTARHTAQKVSGPRGRRCHIAHVTCTSAHRTGGTTAMAHHHGYSPQQHAPMTARPARSTWETLLALSAQGSCYTRHLLLCLCQASARDAVTPNAAYCEGRGSYTMRGTELVTHACMCERLN